MVPERHYRVGSIIPHVEGIDAEQRCGPTELLFGRFERMDRVPGRSERVSRDKGLSVASKPLQHGLDMEALGRRP